MIPFQQAIFYESFLMISLLVTDLPRANSTIRQKSPHMKSTTLHCCNFWTNHAFSTNKKSKFQLLCSYLLLANLWQIMNICSTPVKCLILQTYKFLQRLQTLFMTVLVCDHAQYNLNWSLLAIMQRIRQRLYAEKAGSNTRTAENALLRKPICRGRLFRLLSMSV